MAVIIQTVSDVSARDVNTARGPGRIYDVVLADGTKASTFDSALGTKAQNLVGQMAKVDITSKTNDKGYTNTYLNSIQASDEAASAPGLGAAPQPAAGGVDATAERIARTSGLRMVVDEAIAAGVPGQIDYDQVENYVAWILYAERPGDGPFAGDAEQLGL